MVGYNAGMKPWWMPENVEPQQIFDLYAQQHGAANIIKVLGLSCAHTTLTVWLKDNGVVMRGYGKSGAPTQKVCPGCDNEFTALRSNTTLCKTCAPDKNWQRRFYLYGITKPEFDAKVEAQHGLCDCCGNPLPLLTFEVCVDHCHNQGHVRGIICRQCNSWLAVIENDKFMAQAVQIH